MYLKDKNINIKVRVTEEDYKKLKNIAELNNLSVSEVIRKSLKISFNCFGGK